MCWNHYSLCENVLQIPHLNLELLLKTSQAAILVVTRHSVLPVSHRWLSKNRKQWNLSPVLHVLCLPQLCYFLLSLCSAARRSGSAPAQLQLPALILHHSPMSFIWPPRCPLSPFCTVRPVAQQCVDTDTRTHPHTHIAIFCWSIVHRSSGSTEGIKVSVPHHVEGASGKNHCLRRVMTGLVCRLVHVRVYVIGNDEGAKAKKRCFSDDLLVPVQV